MAAGWYDYWRLATGWKHSAKRIGTGGKVALLLESRPEVTLLPGRPHVTLGESQPESTLTP